MAHRGRDPQRTAEQNSQDERPRAIGQRDREALGDDVVDRAVRIGKGRAEIETGYDPDHVFPELQMPGLVETEFGFDIGQHLRRQRTFGVEWPPRRQPHQNE